MPTTTCLYSTVINLKSTSRFFGFLGKHGKRLAAFQQYSEPGSLTNKISQKPRQFEALKAALVAGDLAIISSPAVTVLDATTLKTQNVTLSGGSLGVADPCWGKYLGKLTAAFAAIGAQTAAIATETVTFTAPVTGVNMADFSMTRGGTNVPLSGVTVATSDNLTFTLSGLASLTATNGTYVITLTALNSGIVDIYNNPLFANATVTWVKS